MSTENEAVSRILLDVCDDEDVSLCRAVDYGSRARGLDGPDSDYDVFFVFAQNPSEYVVKTSYRDTIERTIGADETDLDGDVELHGWNLRKYVGGTDMHGNNGGLLGSNPMAVESVSSNVEYYRAPGTGVVWDELDEHVATNFKPYALMRHYHSLALSNYRKYIEGAWVVSPGVSHEDLFEHEETVGPNDMDVVDHGVDREATLIDDDTGLVHLTSYMRQEGGAQLDIDAASDAGLIERTTTDRSRKRYLNIAQALCKRRYIAETKQVPPMEMNQLLRSCSGLIPEDVYALLGDMALAKRSGSGDDSPRELERLDEWIEDELADDIGPDEYVDRSVDVDVVADYTTRALRTVQ